MILSSSASTSEKKTTAKIFAEELIHLGNWWNENFGDEKRVEDYLKDDLLRFEKIIREEMLRRGAKIE